MTLTDEGDRRDCYLYKLSQREEMGWFRYVVLVGSEQDSYVSFESSRVESENMDVEFHEMEKNFISNLS